MLDSESQTDLGRFVLETFPSGGVILDLESGNYFRVNPAAASLFRVLLESAPADRIRNVQRELGVPEALARQWSDDALARLRIGRVRGDVTGSFRFRRDESSYVLELDGQRLLAVEVGDLSLRLAPGVELSLDSAETCVRAVLPKLLFLHGVTVLHAASCRIGSDLVAFAGASGAGKTTTVRAFAASGAMPRSEDLLLLADGPDDAVVATVCGEAQAHQWAREAARALADRPGVAIDTRAVKEAARGEREAIDRVLFVDRRRRQGTGFATRAIDGGEGLTLLMEANFLGDSDSVVWRRYFAKTAALCRRIHLFETTAPSAVTYLESAASAYIESCTS